MSQSKQHLSEKPESSSEQDDLTKDTVIFDKVNLADDFAAVDFELDTIRPGTTLNKRFDILEVIGSGGMGTVYKALDKRDVEAGNSCFIAIKVLNNECKKSAQFLQALYEETKKTQALSHQNIVTVYDFDRDSNLVYMTMELIEGAPLDQIIKRNPFGVDLPDAIDIINQIGSALSYAHSKHIIHLDLKPGNIFYDRNKQIKILDFGISQKLNSSLSNNDEPSIPIALTPSYASIELLYDEIPGPSDDIYAFACVCYEVLTGKHPYNRERSDVALKKGLVPEKIKPLTRQQWKALKKVLALQKQNRTESIEQFLLEFNAKKPSLKVVVLGGCIAFLLAYVYSYDQFQTDSKNSVAIVEKNKEEDVFQVGQTRFKELLDKLGTRSGKNSHHDSSVKQGSKTETDETNSSLIAGLVANQTKQLKAPDIPKLIDTDKQLNENTQIVTPIQKNLAKEQGIIHLWIDQKTYKIGGTLTISFDVNKALYVQIFVVNSVGEVSILFPSPYQPNNLLKAGEIYQIPPINAEFTLDISEPKGNDRIIAFASSKPFLTSTLAINEFGEVRKEQLKESYIQLQTSYLVY